MSQWTLLVTEGHVRAARWRHAVPFIFSAAVVAVVIGLGIMAITPKAEHSTAVADAQNDFATKRRSAVERYLHGKAEVTRTPPRAEYALTRETAPQSVAALLGEVNRDGRLTTQGVVMQTVQDFWTADFRPGSIHAVDKGQNILIGYLVDNAYRYGNYRAPPQLRRAYGIFRRGAHNQWAYYCLQVEGAQPCESRGVQPSTILVTMHELLPPEAFSPEAKS